MPADQFECQSRSAVDSVPRGSWCRRAASLNRLYETEDVNKLFTREKIVEML